MAHRKIVICGAGFLGSNIARILSSNPQNKIQLTSRNPHPLHTSLSKTPISASLLSPVAADVTKPSTLKPAFESADVVISLVGILHGTDKQFEEIQWKGAENVAKAARHASAKLVHVSAIGADKNSHISYWRTKALAEEAVFTHCPNATVFRPSLLFGPGDGFFARFGKLSSFLPFLPVFGGGTTRFQPIFVDDLARAIEAAALSGDRRWDGVVVQAGGPDVLTYREVMELVLKYSNRWRPIISVPFAVGTVQGLVLEQLPNNLLTVTRSQVEQLKFDNIVDPSLPFPSLATINPTQRLTSVHEILPTYL